MTMNSWEKRKTSNNGGTADPKLNLNNINLRQPMKIDCPFIQISEIIEAQKLFNLDIKKFKILIHPKSYIHCIIRFNNGMIKIIAHDTTMEIPIFNTLYGDSGKKYKSETEKPKEAGPKAEP